MVGWVFGQHAEVQAAGFYLRVRAFEPVAYPTSLRGLRERIPAARGAHVDQSPR